MVPEISKVQSDGHLEVPSDLLAVKSGVYVFLKIYMEESEQHLEISKYARKQCVKEPSALCKSLSIKSGD